ncbi:MAG TPA: hypothetical protein VH933_01165 [Aestuariivirgaceae bacterium]|jgi:hypothetical protein
MKKSTIRFVSLAVAGVWSAMISTAGLADVIRVPDSPCFWEKLDWDQLRNAERMAWMELGWNGMRWDSDDSSWSPASDNKDWGQLTSRERDALLRLGYTEESWDNFDTDSCFENARITQRLSRRNFGAAGEARDTLSGPSSDDGLED